MLQSIGMMAHKLMPEHIVKISTLVSMLREQYPMHNFERFVDTMKHGVKLYRIVLNIENCGTRTVELYANPCKKA